MYIQLYKMDCVLCKENRKKKNGSLWTTILFLSLLFCFFAQNDHFVNVVQYFNSLNGVVNRMWYLVLVVAVLFVICEVVESWKEW